MFGWLKSLFGSEPAQETVVPPPLPPKAKKVEKSSAPKAAKKTAPKTAKAPRVSKKKEDPVVPVEATVTVETIAPKKKGGRPKKSS